MAIARKFVTEAMKDFVAQVARMTPYPEDLCDDRDQLEDAVATMNELIQKAKTLQSHAR